MVAYLSLTANGAVTNATSGSAVVDLFGVIGSARQIADNDLFDLFDMAHKLDSDLVNRMLLWVRDIRQGAGERATFKRLLRHVAKRDVELAKRIAIKIPELGRWDDLECLLNTEAEGFAIELIKDGLIVRKDPLCGKWMPRKGRTAAYLAKRMGLTPKQYRRLIVDVSAQAAPVEVAMSAKQWGSIKYEHVPSVAFARYRNAYIRHDGSRYNAFISVAAKGEAKINAGAIFPHDILRGFGLLETNDNQSAKEAADAQWKLLPDYIPEGVNIFPMIDVSGSMGCIGEGEAMDKALALGVYCSQRCKGEGRNKFLTFSESPTIVSFAPDMNIIDLIQGVADADWGMNTNIQAAFAAMIEQNIDADVLLILSDMEFDACGDNTNFENVKAMFAHEGKKMPKVVFWNLDGRIGNMPVTVKDNGVACVSGFSPIIMKTVLSGSSEILDLIKETLNIDRYNY